MHRVRERFRRFSLRDATLAGTLGLGVAWVVTITICGMGFQPGWANGWPGVSTPTAFATVITAMLTAASLGIAGAVSAFPCFGLDRLVRRDFVGWGVFLLALLAWSYVAIAFVGDVFAWLEHAVALELE